MIVEIVRPGTGDPVADGEVGEVVVTSFNPDYPMIRLATGDLSAVMPGASPCGRTNMRIKGWMGRADQTTKVKGMFVHPGAGRRDREAPSRTRPRAARRHARGRAGRDDAAGGMRRARGAGSRRRGRGDAAVGDQGRGEVKLVAPGSAAERRQGDRRRAKALIKRIAPFVSPAEDLMTLSAKSLGIGQPVRRKEDLRLLTGQGRYSDDVNLPGPGLCGDGALAARACAHPRRSTPTAALRGAGRARGADRRAICSPTA